MAASSEIETMEVASPTLIDEASLRLPLIRPRLSDVLFAPREKGFDTLAVVQSNVRAVESAMRFATAVNPFVALIGPSGWGKSHLLEASARRIRCDSGGIQTVVVSAGYWQSDSRLRLSTGPLILDNAQDLVSRARSRSELIQVLEKRMRSGRPTLLSFTESKLTRSIRSALPHFREWVVAVVRTPNTDEREAILDVMATTEGISLSPTLRRVMAEHMGGNGRTLLGALKRLRLTQSDWLDDGATLKACGILNPFLAGDSGWDLREHIAEQAHRLPESVRALTPPFDLTVYVMLRIALLAEADVAAFFRIEPAKAYLYANRFETAMGESPERRMALETFVQGVVRSLL